MVLPPEQKKRRKKKSLIAPRTGLGRTILTSDDGIPERPKRPPEDILFGPARPSLERGQLDAVQTASFSDRRADILFGGNNKGEEISPNKIAPAGAIGPGESTIEVDPEGNLPDDAEWRPDKMFHDSGKAVIKTDGPIRIDAISNTLGIDGIAYTVEWHAMDAHGNIIPNLVGPDHELERGGGHLLPGGRAEFFEPPFPSEHGYVVNINIRPSQTVPKRERELVSSLLEYIWVVSKGRKRRLVVQQDTRR